MSGYMQASVISEVLHMVWFDGKTSQGVIFEKLFNPIPFETLSLIMTIVSLQYFSEFIWISIGLYMEIDFCIDEWSTGNRIKAKFWEKDVIERHKVFHTDVENWSSLNPVAVEGIRKKYYIRAS